MKRMRERVSLAIYFSTNDLTFLVRVCHPLRAVELAVTRSCQVVTRCCQVGGPDPGSPAAAHVELVVNLGRVVAAAGAHALRLRGSVGVERLPRRGVLLGKWSFLKELGFHFLVDPNPDPESPNS